MLAAIEAELQQLKDAQPYNTIRLPDLNAHARAVQPLFAHLPHIERRHEPESCFCGKCGKDLVKIGEDVSKQLDVELVCSA